MPTVMITGGARRLGGELARVFASKGYDVGITFNTSEDLARTMRSEFERNGIRFAARQCDVANEAALTRAFEELCAELGTPQVVVSNAGIFPDATPVAELAIESVREAIDINTLPLITLAKAYQHAMQESEIVGRLISISSVGANEIWKDRLSYNVSKRALITVVQSLARNMAPRMAVNTVAPGAIRMPAEPTVADDALSRTDRIPMGRYGTPNDVADAVWFFATCSAYITGQCIGVDGGYELHR